MNPSAADRPPLFIRLSLPNGLEESLEALAREVLRSQPKDIYKFAAEHFEEQLKKRNKEQGFPEDKDLNFISVGDGPAHSTEERNGEVNGQNGKVAEDGTELESLSGHGSVNGEDDAKGDGEEDLDNAATKIQAGYKGSQARKEANELKESDESETLVGKKTIDIKMPSQVIEDEEEEAQAEEEKPEEEEEPCEVQDVRAEEKPSQEKEGAVEEDVAKEHDDDNETVVNDMRESIDIDLEDPDVEVAATKIQAGYKGMKARSEVKQKRKQKEDEEAIADIDLEDPEVEQAATRIQAGFKGHKARKEVAIRKQVMEEKAEEVPKTLDEFNRMVEDDIVDIDLSDPQVQDAATTIQAGYRGHKTRKDVQGRINNAASPEGLDMEQEAGGADTGEKDDIDIDLEDPEVELAATKIQAGFKGHKTRKEMKSRNETPPVKIEEDGKEIDFDMDDPELDMAATKIQAGFKGHQTRKMMKEGDKSGEDSLGLEKTPNAGEDIEFDIDLEDPDVEKAATKIQAGFKGHKTRQSLQASRASENPSEGELLLSQDPSIKDANEKDDDLELEEEMNGGAKNERHSDGSEIDIDLEDPEVEKAATKIQAGFKGHKARKDIKTRKELLHSVDKIPDDKAENGEIDIDLDDPEVEQAATKIQAGFKGHKARKELRGESKSDRKEIDSGSVNEEKTEDEEIDIDLEDPEVEMAATKIQAGFKGHKARKELKANSKEDQVSTKSQENDDIPKNGDEEIDIDLDDPEVAMAATKIQAGFKGHKARKELKANDNEEKSSAEKEEQNNNAKAEEEEIDIDLEDPDVEKAATKIQAGFKGHQARKDLKAQRKEQEDVSDTGEENKLDIAQDNPNETEEIDIDLTDPDVEVAATKIQAGFKGHKARKELKANNHQHEANGEENIEDEVFTNEDAKEEDNIDIDLNDPEVEQAATKIQAGFKGHKTRKEMKEKNREASDKDENEAKEEEIDIDLDDPDVEKAATKIQAGFKGHKTRKEMREKSTGEATEAEAEEEVDIDLNDPEVEAAATKIQAGFKGHQARTRVKGMKEDKASEAISVAEAGQGQAEENAEPIDIDLEDPDVEAAATKIQAGYRGMKTRNEYSVREDKEAVIDPEDLEVQQAATQIQAGYRGMKARQDVKAKRASIVPNEEVIDIDLEDPEVEKAASKIQAGFKGHQVRKGMRERNEEGGTTDDANGDMNDGTGAEPEVDWEGLEEVDEAATKIQAGFKGMKARKEVEEMRRNRAEEPESLTIISDIRARPVPVAEEEVIEVTTVHESGAIPFEKHPSANEEKEEEEDEDPKKNGSRADTAGSERVQEGLVLNDSSGGKGTLGRQASTAAQSSLENSLNKPQLHSPIMVYHYRASFNSQKVLAYLHERGIDFTAYHLDLSLNEHLSPWYLEMNPRGEVPAIKFEDKVAVDSTRIIHLLEARVPVDAHPALVPCTSDTRLYQLYVYLIAILDEIPLQLLTQGLAFHPQFSLCHPSPPYDNPEHLGMMRKVVEARSRTLLQAAEDSQDGNVQAELRKKAAKHEQESLPVLKQEKEYEALLDQTAVTLGKVEEQLSKTMNLHDECPAWLLGPSFSALDIILGVTLNRLAMLGLQRLWLDCEDRKPHVERFLKEIQKRPSFARAVTDYGSADGNAALRPLAAAAETAVEVGAVGGGGSEDVMSEMERILKDEKKKTPFQHLQQEGSSQSIEVFEELKQWAKSEEEK